MIKPPTFSHSFLIVLLSLGITACDSLLSTRCAFENRSCDGSAADAGNSPQDAEAATEPAIVERSFEWRAKVPLDSKTKFVGLYLNNSAIFLHDVTVSGTSNWIWMQQRLDLTAMNESSRLKLQSCASCPSLASFDPGKDSAYLAGNNYYVFTYQGKVIKYTSGSSGEVLSNIDDATPSPRPFVHPDLNALAFTTQVVSQQNFIAAVLPGKTWLIYHHQISPTGFVLGDLDAVDENNGYELIIFNGRTADNVQHQKTAISDDDLLNSLQLSMDLVKKGNETSVSSAFIGNLNKDKYTDLIFSDSNVVFAMSYLGRFGANGPKFLNWQEPIIEITGEIIKSVVASDLTLDGSPELIVETDHAVHFYLNIPKP